MNPKPDLDSFSSGLNAERSAGLRADHPERNTAPSLAFKIIVCTLFLFHGVQIGAGTTYVISTDGAPLNSGYLSAIGATQGLSTPGFVFLSPSSPGSINGTPLNFGGFANNTALFGVVGDLNLNNGDNIYGVGANFLRLEVGNDGAWRRGQ